jgi:ribosomal protein S18 acetylase RimI-like enzyme
MKPGGQQIMPDDITIIKKTPSVKQFNALRELVGWGKIDGTQVKQGLKRSLYSICAIKNGRVIGCCRLVGDGFLRIYIEELMIHPHYQKRGIGTKLMENIMHYIKQKYKAGCSIGLFSSKNLEFFYNRFGFTRREENMPGMQIYMK